MGLDPTDLWNYCAGSAVAVSEILPTTSRENVETVRRAFATWHADNLEGFLAEVHPEVEWHGVIEGVVGGKASTYRGHEGARQGWAEYRGEAFGRLELRAEEIRDLGESVLLLGRFVVTGRTTALEFGQEVGEIYTFRERKIVTVRDFPSHAQALEAAGVRE
jgi:ketosteroid isomerase-like protein